MTSQSKSRKKSFVVAKCAQTLDGKIATAKGESKWISSFETRKFSRQTRKKFDGILVGINTVLADDPVLETALPHKTLKKIILDSRLRIPLSSKLIAKSAKHCVVFTLSNVSPTKVKKLQNLGVEVVQAPKQSKQLKIKWVLKKLLDYGIVKVLIEGGAHVVGSALKEQCVDQMHVYISPKVIGDHNALGAVSGLNILRIHKTVNLTFKRIQKINQDILVIADVHRNR